MAARKPQAPAHLARRTPPFFRPVPPRARNDGWSVERQCRFLAELYVAGSVSIAAKRVGLSRASAYRLRERADAASFARAWDSVLAGPGAGRLPPVATDWRKVTQSELIEHLESGFVQPVIYHGEMTAIRKRFDKSALLRLVRRGRNGATRHLGNPREDLVRLSQKPPVGVPRGSREAIGPASPEPHTTKPRPPPPH